MGGAIREETCQIEPTVIENISWDNAIMQEENFWSAASDTDLYGSG